MKKSKRNRGGMQKMNKLEEESRQHVKPKVKSRREMRGKENINGRNIHGN